MAIIEPRGNRDEYALSPRPIGVGGQAEVFEATHRPSGFGGIENPPWGGSSGGSSTSTGNNPRTGEGRDPEPGGYPTPNPRPFPWLSPGVSTPEPPTPTASPTPGNACSGIVARFHLGGLQEMKRKHAADTHGVGQSYFTIPRQGHEAAWRALATELVLEANLNGRWQESGRGNCAANMFFASRALSDWGQVSTGTAYHRATNAIVIVHAAGKNRGSLRNAYPAPPFGRIAP